MVDSGAADNFISADTVARLKLPQKQLPQPMAICVGNGQIIHSRTYVQVTIFLGKYLARTFFKVLDTPIPMVLGYTFLVRHQPIMDWPSRKMTITRRGYAHVIQVFPSMSMEGPDSQGFSPMSPRRLAMPQWSTPVSMEEETVPETAEEQPCLQRSRRTSRGEKEEPVETLLEGDQGSPTETFIPTQTLSSAYQRHDNP